MFDLLNYEYADKWAFLLFILFVPLIAWYIYNKKRANATIQISSIKGFKGSVLILIYDIFLFVIRLVALSLFIIALARPQATDSWENKTTEGIDIVMAIDVSTSMLAEDLKPNRLEAAKNLAQDFVLGRPYDRIGLVVFSGESFTQCPLTTDHAVLVNLFKDVKSGIIEDGTAIGMGLGTSINRLKESKAISKVVILLTDGVNNRGAISPLTAADIAKKYGIRVYTIGVGTIGTAPYPFQTAFGTTYRDVEVKIDEETLQQIAINTDGKYFRATSNKKLKQVYQEIDQLEKSKIDVKEYSKKEEKFFIFALIGAILLLIELALRNSLIKIIP